MSLRVLLIDDHTLFRVGLEGLLAHRSIDVIASIGEGREGLKCAAELNPDVVLLDMRMPDINGIGVLKKLRETGFQNPVVMLTTSTDEHDLVESLRNGAQGYLLKDMEPDELVLALRDIVAGKTVVAPDLAPVLAKVVRWYRAMAHCRMRPHLSTNLRHAKVKSFACWRKVKATKSSPATWVSLMARSNCTSRQSCASSAYTPVLRLP